MLFESILLTIITASTPLLIAALGELVTEKAGVLNLGVEGMMVMGAACGFAGAVIFDSTVLGVLCGTLAGTATALLFAVVVLGFGANQTGAGLALTIFGLGLSGLLGHSFIGAKREPVSMLFIPYLSDIPFFGKVLFSQDAFVYFSFALTLLVYLFLNKTRAGLNLRAIGENHNSAHVLGLPVLKIRFWAILFGGACAGISGVYLSLVYTRFWSTGMTSGKGWIAIALVVFASWKPGWAVVGAYIFGAASVLQLHAQAAQFNIPHQILTAFPYVATILALLIKSIRYGRMAGAPGSLGIDYVLD
ncbi:MAG: ABC transporter permease [Methylobacteriaceae bacterium]|jgi:simple sugar transport system permease protein|nr:ABC transporter permease [Methylobacteriaceae bacterium]